MSYFGTKQEVLVDGRSKGRWQGRTRTDKLVFFESTDAELGDLMDIRITKTTPWSLQGRPAFSADPLAAAK
jgi:tRNA-2-methylthio-N6-dimethylallyladenosine synthase